MILRIDRLDSSIGRASGLQAECRVEPLSG